MTISELGRVIRTFTLEQPFFGHLVLKLQKEITLDDSRCPTAMVQLDPQSLAMYLVFNGKFWDSIAPHERKGLIHHEILHMAFMHLELMESFPDKKTANIAMDMEINQIVGKQNLPKGGVFIDESPYKELNLPTMKGSKFYYDVLIEEQKNGNQPVKQAVQNGGPGNHKWGSMKGMSTQQRKLFKNQQKHLLKEAVEETGGLKGMGGLPGGLSRMLEKLLKKTPEIFNWKAFFRRYIGTIIDVKRKKTHKRSSKRFGDGTPGLRTKRKQRVFVSVDVSGSMGMKEVAEGFAQLHSIYEAGAHIDVVTWDSAIQEKFVYTGKAPTKVTGGGGSDIGLAIREFNLHKKDYTFAVHFTDGYVNNSEPLIGKHLFIITSEGSKFDAGSNGNYTMIQIPKLVKE